MQPRAYHGGLSVGLGKQRPGEVRFARSPEGTPFSYYLLLLFLMLLYSNAALLVPELEVLQPAQMVGMGALFILFVERALGRRGFDLVWPESYLLLGFLGVAALSAFTALWVKHAAEATLNLAKFVAIYFLILNAVDTKPRLRLVVWTMVLGGLFPALGAIHHYLEGKFVEGGRTGWIGIFANPNELAYSLVILLPLALFLGSGRDLWTRLLMLGALGVYGVAIFLSFSRGGMLGFFVVVLFMGLRQPRRSLRLATLALLAAGMVFIGYFWSRDQGFTNLSADATFHQRVATMQAGLAMFVDRPLLGVGLNCSILGWPLYAPQDVFSYGWLHNHNTFLQVLSETGLLGFIPFVLLLAAAFYQTHGIRVWATRTRHQDLARLAAALDLSLWGFVVSGLSGGYALSWFPYLLVGLISSTGKVTERLRREVCEGGD